MPTQLISASGTNYGMAVNPDGSINANVLGSVFIGSVSAHVDSMYVQSGDNINITSLPGDLGSVVISESTRLGVSGGIFTGGDLTGSFAQKGIGSIVIKSAPLIGISGAIFTEGNIVGSFAPKGIGSVIIKSAPLIGVSGAIFDSGDITGSMVISQSTKLGVSGIVEVSNTVQTAGSIWSMPGITIGSVHADVDSIYIQSGDNLAITSMPTVTVQSTDLDIRDLTSASDSVEITGTSEIGSVVISSAPLIGISGDKLDKLAGSMGVTALPAILGSVYIKSGVVGVSGDYFQDMLGSVRISAPPLGVSGTIFDDGNLTGSMAMKGIGSMVISSSTKLGVSGIVEVNEVIPTNTTRQNPSFALVYDPADAISGIYFQTGTGSYFQSFLWDAGSNIVYISEWSTI